MSPNVRTFVSIQKTRTPSGFASTLSDLSALPGRTWIASANIIAPPASLQQLCGLLRMTLRIPTFRTSCTCKCMQVLTSYFEQERIPDVRWYQQESRPKWCSHSTHTHCTRTLAENKIDGLWEYSTRALRLATISLVYNSPRRSVRNRRVRMRFTMDVLGVKPVYSWRW